MRMLLMVVAGSMAALASGCASAPESHTFAAESPRAEAGADRQLVRRAWLDIQVRDPGTAVEQVQRIVRESGGSIESSTTTGDDAARLDLRVPASSLDDVLAALRRIGAVQRENTSVTDVTDEVSDLDARLVNLIAVRDRLRGYLDRAEDLEDVIAIERELTRVQTEIDAMTSRLERLRGQVAMARVSVALNRETVLGPLGLLVAGVAWVVGKLFVLN